MRRPALDQPANLLGERLRVVKINAVERPCLFEKLGDFNMPILRIPTPLHAYVSGQAEVNVSGTGVFEALSDLTTQHPAIFNENAVLRPFVNLFIGQDNIEDLQGTATSLKDGEKIAFVPSIARG
ncbi:MAG: hypothetical protein B6D38_00410 [Anaerolineae bacterium UTCFX1]|jgi:molybdopterin converting factor small subunit|nr:MAG: hypothetical protein B6D38_00410 [Anaerolineae bacterium UTCFX1]